MSDEIASVSLSDTSISIPSFLSTDDYGVMTVSDCETQMGDCGNCQGDIQECGYTEYGDCSVCEGYGGQSCYEDCLEDCSEGPCTCMDCEGEAGDGCLCAGGQGQYDCGQPCGEPTPDPCSYYCMDCENSCQGSIQEQIDPWDWFANDETIAAYNAITNNGQTIAFSHNVWNDLVDRVRDVRNLAEISPVWDETYADYNATRMSAVDKELTAVRFNSLWRNINYLWATGITVQSKGDIVYGSYFTSLTTALNNYIALL